MSGSTADIEKNATKAEEKIALKDAEEIGDVDRVKNGGPDIDPKVDIKKPKDDEFCGLTKEELQKFVDDPHWKKIRLILFILFWVAWVAMLAAAIIIIIVAPKCPYRPNMKWWQKSLFYKICPASFKDTDKDGFGDFKGIEDKLEYIKGELKSDVILLTSIFESPYGDLGNDVISLDNLNEKFGNEGNFKSLITAAKKKNMYIVIDFPINNVFHEKNKWWMNNEEDKFVVLQKETSFKTIYNTESWLNNNSRLFYAAVHNQQLDLNLTNQDVLNYIFKSMKKWMDAGVSGFRILRTPYLVEPDEEITDENYMYSNQTFELLANLSKEVGSNVLIADITDSNNDHSYYDRLLNNGIDLIDDLNLKFLTETKDINVGLKNIENIINNVSWPFWSYSNENTKRFDSNENWEFSNMINLLMKGTPIIYYGNEIAMINDKNTYSIIRDQYLERDQFRAPMRWSHSKNAGFSEGNSTDLWLPISNSTEMPDICVDCQIAEGSKDDTPLKFFKKLATLRSEPSFQFGDMDIGSFSEIKHLFAFTRIAKGFPGFLVVINANNHASTTNLNIGKVPEKGKIALITSNSDDHTFEVGNEIETKSVRLPPMFGLILRFEKED